MASPGVYIKSIPAEQTQGHIRSDRGCLLGYAARGPVNVAVALTNFVEFKQVFGSERVGYLLDSAEMFFANGGTDLFVIRINAQDSYTAKTTLPATLGRFDCFAAAPAYVGPGSATQMNEARKYEHSDHFGTARFYRLKSPGSWGNDLKLNITLNAQSMINVVEYHGSVNRLRLASVANIEVGTVLDLSQILKDEVAIESRWVDVVAVNMASREVTLAATSAELIDVAKISEANQVFVTAMRLRVFYRQQMVEEFEPLGLHPNHSRYFVEVVNQTSIWLGLAPTGDFIPGDWDWLNTVQGDHELSDGLAQLHLIAATDFSKAIEQVELEREIGLLAAPDLVYRHRALVQQSPAILVDDICLFAEFNPKGSLTGTVLSQVDETAVKGARVIIATSGSPGLTLERFCDDDGVFTVNNVPAGTAMVSVEASGFVYEDFSLTIEAEPLSSEAVITIEPIALAPEFDPPQILALQQQLLELAVNLRRFFVLLDPPASANRLSEISDWRYHFDCYLASLVYPWLSFDELEQDRELPASAVVMGALAGVDRQKGLVYSTANIKMITHGQLQHRISPDEHQQLNDNHVNCLVLKPGSNITLLGARTLSFDSQWRYVSTSRIILYVIRYLEQRMQWAAFEPNNLLLRIAIVSKLNGLLSHLWRKGALRGQSPKEAFTVVCDQTNNSAADVDQGILVADLGLAIAEPMEFIWLTYQRQTDQSNIRIS